MTEKKSTKQCPQCKTEIDATAKKCPQCHSDLRNGFAKHPLLTLLGILFLVGLIGAVVNSPSNNGNSNTNQEVQQTTPPKTEQQILKEKAVLEKNQADAAAKAKVAEEAAQAEQAAFEKTLAGKICKSHPTWAKDDCTHLADRKIWIGMSYDMLVYERGKPDSTNPSNYGTGTQYQWCWHDYTPSCFYYDNDDGIINSYN